MADDLAIERSLPHAHAKDPSLLAEDVPPRERRLVDEHQSAGGRVWLLARESREHRVAIGKRHVHLIAEFDLGEALQLQEGE